MVNIHMNGMGISSIVYFLYVIEHRIFRYSKHISLICWYLSRRHSNENFYFLYLQCSYTYKHIFYKYIYMFYFGSYFLVLLCCSLFTSSLFGLALDMTFCISSGFVWFGVERGLVYIPVVPACLVVPGDHLDRWHPEKKKSLLGNNMLW